MSYFPKKFSILKTLFSKNYSIEKFLNEQDTKSFIVPRSLFFHQCYRFNLWFVT